MDLIEVDVKLADMLHNSGLNRFNSYDDKTLSLMSRYNKGLKFSSERNFGVDISVFDEI